MIFYSRSKYIRWMWCPFSSFRNRDGSFSYRQWRKTHGKSRIFSPTSNKMYTGILAWKVDFFPTYFTHTFLVLKNSAERNFSKIYGNVGVISWFLFHLIWKNYVLYWDFDLKSWIVDFFTHSTQEKTPQNNFSSQNFSVENNYLILTVKMGVKCLSTYFDAI